MSEEKRENQSKNNSKDVCPECGTTYGRSATVEGDITGSCTNPECPLHSVKYVTCAICGRVSALCICKRS